MLIRCPQCSTAFNVPTSAIGESGRKVKCTKCAHIWFQEPLKQADLNHFLNIEERLKPLNDLNTPPNLPARVEKYFNLPRVAIICVAAVVFASTTILAQHEKFPAVKKLFLMEATDGLRLSDFNIKKSINDNKYQFDISGYLVNTSDDTKTVPKITIQVMTKGKRVLDTKKITLPQETIDPATQIFINSKVTGISGNADEVHMVIANPWEKAFD